MPARNASPTPSDHEVDIFDSLYPDDGAANDQGAAAQDVDFDDILDGARENDEDGDEAFIALQQAAAYRKSSNLKGRTVKKGGGFQAMGM